MTVRLSLLPVIGMALVLSACGPEPMAAFALRFAAIVDGIQAGCTNEVGGFGPDGGVKVGVSDLRFYVSNVRFSDSRGKPVDLELDSNEFQLKTDAGAVALVDLTGNAEGSCAESSLAFAEGTPRTNGSVVGQTRLGEVSTVAFDVGVPQLLMKQTIATYTLEGAPTPLNEMYWSWASGYRHFVFNFTVQAGDGSKGSGYVHVGSRNCGPMAGKALEDRDTCEFVNTASVELTDFDFTRSSVGVDLKKLLGDIDFITDIRDPQTRAVIGQGPGVECHSAPTQPDCGLLMTRMGIDSSGVAAAASNQVFVRR